jgi:ribosomal protein L16 Arg81 hydroxylase
MREGVTAVLEAVNELSPTVAGVTQRLGGEFRARSAANAYISFGDRSGFGTHNDDHDVIVVQIDGKKKWRFFKSGPGAGKATASDLDCPGERDCGEELTVSAGDVMYIPKGTWHDVVAMNERSLHLTIRLVYPTVADFVKWGLKRDRRGIPFADIRPAASDQSDLAGVCRRYADHLIRNEHIELFLRSFYDGYACSPVQANLLALNSAFPHDEYRRIPFDVVVLPKVKADGTVRIRAGAHQRSESRRVRASASASSCEFGGRGRHGP